MSYVLNKKKIFWKKMHLLQPPCMVILSHLYIHKAKEQEKEGYKNQIHSFYKQKNLNEKIKT